MKGGDFCGAGLAFSEDIILSESACLYATAHESADRDLPDSKISKMKAGT